MSYWWVALSIIMVGSGLGLAILVFPFLYKTVDEPDFMEEDRGTIDQTQARRIDAMGQIVDIRA